MLDETFNGKGRGCFSGFADSEVTFDVFSEDVRLEIDEIAWLAMADVGVGIGKRDDGNPGDAIVPIRDGETHAVNRNGAFGDDVAGNLGWRSDGVTPAVALGREFRHAADTVNMPENEMSAKLLACGERLFQIYGGAGLEGA